MYKQFPSLYYFTVSVSANYQHNYICCSRLESKIESKVARATMTPASLPSRPTSMKTKQIPRKNTTGKFKCHICQMEFVSVRVLNGHKRSHSSKLVPKPLFRCKYCKICFFKESDAEKHANSTHEGKQPYHCPVCTVGFTQVGSMNRHYAERHVCHACNICSDCEASFCRSVDLEEHRSKEHP